MTLEEFYNKNKPHIVAIYLAGSSSIGVDSTHDTDYAIYFRNTADYEAVREDIEWLKRSNERHIDVFIHYVGETHKPMFWSVHQKYWKLLHGEAVKLYDVLEHKDETTSLLKKLVNTANKKTWGSVYLLAMVLKRQSYTLADEDYQVVRDIYASGNVPDEVRAKIVAVANAL